MGEAEVSEGMMVRLLRSFLVGVGLASLLVALVLAALWIYLHFFWALAHPGMGGVAGGIYIGLWLAPVAFVAGFVWEWRLLRGEKYEG